MYIIYAHNIIIAYQVCKNADKKKQPPHKVTALIQNPKKLAIPLQRLFTPLTIALPTVFTPDTIFFATFIAPSLIFCAPLTTASPTLEPAM